MPLTEREIQEKIAQSRAAGIPEEVIQQKVQQARYQAPVQQSGGGLGDVVLGVGKAIADPFVGTLKTIGGAGVEVGRAQAQNIAKSLGILDEDLAQKLMAQTAFKNPFLGEQELGEFSANNKEGLAGLPKGLVKQAGRSLQVGSYAIPGGSSLLGATGKSALASTIGGAGMELAKNEFDVGDIASATVAGGAGGAAGYGIGKGIQGLGWLKDKVSSNLSGVRDKAAKKAAASMLDNLSSRYTEAAKAGVDLNDVLVNVSKEAPGDSLDDLIGPISQRGKGGFLNQRINEATQQIDEFAEALGPQPIADDVVDDVINQMTAARDKAAGSLGITSSKKAEQWNKIIEQYKVQARRGVSVEDAVKTVREANKRFGDDVALKGVTESIDSAANKIRANTYRSFLHTIPTIGEPLKQQQKYIIARNAFEAMRPREMAKGFSILKTLRSLDISRPGTIIDAAVRSDPARRVMMGLGQGTDEVSSGLGQNADEVLRGITDKAGRRATEQSNMLASLADDPSVVGEFVDNQLSQVTNNGANPQQVAQDINDILRKNNFLGRTFSADDVMSAVQNKPGRPLAVRSAELLADDVARGTVKSPVQAQIELDTISQALPSDQQSQVDVLRDVIGTSGLGAGTQGNGSNIQKALQSIFSPEGLSYTEARLPGLLKTSMENELGWPGKVQGETTSNMTNQIAGQGLAPQQGGTGPLIGPQEQQMLQLLALQAAASGDTKALESIQSIQQIFDTMGGGSDLNVGKVTAQNYGNAQSGISSLERVKSLIFDPSGDLDRSTIIALKTPGTPSQKARQLKAQLYNVADTYLRLRTGAQANPSEIERLAESLEPGLFDDPNTVMEKLGIYGQTFDQIAGLGQGVGIGQEQPIPQY